MYFEEDVGEGVEQTDEVFEGLVDGCFQGTGDDPAEDVVQLQRLTQLLSELGQFELQHLQLVIEDGLLGGGVAQDSRRVLLGGHSGGRQQGRQLGGRVRH